VNPPFKFVEIDGIGFSILFRYDDRLPHIALECSECRWTALYPPEETKELSDLLLSDAREHGKVCIYLASPP
jgi:hypothetical protein